LSTGGDRTELVKLATRLFLEEAPDAGMRDAQGRDDDACGRIMPDTRSERPVLERMFGAVTRAAERWRAIRFTDVDRRRIAAVQKDLDAENTAADTTPGASRQTRPAAEISRSFRT
jgi:hypothetical protein